MGFIRGYKFITKEEADSKMNQLNVYYGLPVPDGVSYFSEDSYQQIDDFYFIAWHEMLEPVLGEAEEIEITDSSEPTSLP